MTAKLDAIATLVCKITYQAAAGQIVFAFPKSLRGSYVDDPAFGRAVRYAKRALGISDEPIHHEKGFWVLRAEVVRDIAKNHEIEMQEVPQLLRDILVREFADALIKLEAEGYIDESPKDVLRIYRKRDLT